MSFHLIYRTNSKSYIIIRIDYYYLLFLILKRWMVLAFEFPNPNLILFNPVIVYFIQSLISLSFCCALYRKYWRKFDTHSIKGNFKIYNLLKRTACEWKMKDEEVNGKCINNFASLKPTTYYYKSAMINNLHIITVVVFVVVVVTVIVIIFSSISYVALE